MAVERGPVMPVTTPLGVLLSLQLAVAPPAPPPPPPTPSATATPPVGDAAPDASAGGSDLAAEAPVGEWTPEGGAAAHKSAEDPQVVNKKIRRAAKTTIAGGSIAILGIAAGISGLVMYTISSKQLTKLKSDNDGVLPPGDPKRQRALTLVRVGPALAYAGAGLFVVGAITALVAGRRFKKLREDKRTSVAFTPVPMLRGGGLAAEVRF